MIEVQEVAPGAYEIDWDEQFSGQSVDIHAATDPAFQVSDLVAKNLTRKAVIENLDPGARYYFRLSGANGAQRTAAQRDVRLEGAVNFRDFGGYPTLNGRYTRWGTLYRSGHLSRLNENDQAYLSRFNLKTVCDFRRPVEIESEASRLPGDPTTHNVPITPGARDPNHIEQLFAGTENPQDVFDAMIDIMRILIVDAASQYKRLLELLLEHQSGAFLMNCSAGKERTGVGAAIVLMALGASRATIEADFLLSGRYYPIEREVPRVFEKYNVKLTGDAGVALIMPLLEAKQAYIQVVFDEIDKRYSSDEDFIRETYGLGDAELRELRKIYTE